VSLTYTSLSILAYFAIQTTVISMPAPRQIIPDDCPVEYLPVQVSDTTMDNRITYARAEKTKQKVSILNVCITLICFFAIALYLEARSGI
jgi:hypothetical protein